ncbi:LOW QUALITY PROTEIN: E3 SUMO-protein ligase ZNF451 [Gastrophryne carolinensis]
MDPVASDENSPAAEEHAAKDDPSSEEEEIEFISEGQLRPVLECIDLVSSDDEVFNVSRKPKDHIDYQKERVASTLDRLAQHVEVEKRQKAKKNKAFQDKLNYQHAHGLQELEFTKDHPGTSAAKFCVKQWLNMPGLRPGVVSSSRRNFPQPRELGSIKSQPITCPIMHCNKKFDNAQLLFGHLKRFDHSPCDPTIYLHGACENLYACLICHQRFATLKEYNAHLFAKAKLTDGHERLIPAIVVDCFACPSCFLLFNQRDECLKHMSANNHFLRSIISNGQGVPCPVPIPSYAKRVLIALCKDITFQVVCTSCRTELRSHMEVTAHFKTRCRNAGPVSLSEKSISDVASIFQLTAVCLTCKQALKDETCAAKHFQKTSHKVKKISSMETSILMFCYVNDGIKTPSDFCLSAANARIKPCMLKRTLENDDLCNTFPKYKKGNECNTTDDCLLKKEIGISVTAWFCECSLQFTSEKAAEKHIMAANRIFHKCLVCGKRASDLSIIHLHMSRFHGGAHLNNFRFWCEICSIELPRTEDVLTHIVDCHGGHSFYFEKEVLEKPSTTLQTESSTGVLESVSPSSSEQSTTGLWQCHVCEEMFDSEDSVQQHCKSLTIHQFHKYCCDTCKKKFHKLETLLRHCQLQHDGDVKVKYFCGLCEDLFFEEETDFLAHYEGFHSLDYGFVPNQRHSPTKSPEVSSTTSSENDNRLTCGCLAEYTEKAQKKSDGNLCLARLFEKGKIWYSCCSCSATDQTAEGLATHHCGKDEQSADRKFVIKCSVCSKSFTDPSGAQSHFHNKHCFLEKTSNSYPFRNDVGRSEVFKFTASATSVKDKLVKPEKAFAKHLPYEAQGRAPNICNQMIGKSKEEPEPMEIDHADTGLQENELPDMDFLCTMTHIVFIDLDNWAQFFSYLPGYLNQGTFVWGFQGGKNVWKPPKNCKNFKYLSNTGCFFLHPRCGDRKDAADFAICMHAGRLDEPPKGIPFTVLSGDKGFMELENQFKKTQRSAHILNPHHLGGDVMWALLNSISETTNQDADMKEAIRRSLLET